MIAAFVEGLAIGARAIGAVVAFAGIGLFIVSLGVFVGWACGRLVPEDEAGTGADGGDGA